MLNRIKTLFWNKAENRPRAVWRLSGQLVLMGVFLAIAQLLFGLFMGAAAIRSPGNKPPLADLNDPNSFPGQMLLVVSGLSVAASVWAAGRFLDRRNFKDFGFSLTKSWWVDFAFGLGLGALLMTVIFLIEWAAGWIQVQAIPAGLNSGLSILPALAVSLGIFLIVGFYEELLTRGYLIKNISEGMAGLPIGRHGAILIAVLFNSTVFGFLHAANPNSTIGSSLNIGLAGLFLATGYILTGQLSIPIGIHISWNFFQGSVFGFPVSGTSFGRYSIIKISQLGPDLWTGGQFGPEGGLLGTLTVLLGSALIALWIYYQHGTIGLKVSLSEYQIQDSDEHDFAQDPPSESMDLPQIITNAQLPGHLVWDWNGTLLDDLDLCLEIINGILESRELPALTREDYREVFGFPVKEYYRRLGFDFSIEPFEDISTGFITTYERRRPDCQLMAGARKALEAASRLSIPQSILSASRLDYLAPAVDEYGIGSYFSHILGLDNHHAAGKLDLAEYFLISNDLDPANVLVIGDTAHDAAITHALGMSCILIPKGHHSEQRLQQTGAVIVDSLDELSGILRKLAGERL